MRRYWLVLGAGLLTAALAIGAVACGEEEEEPTATVEVGTPTVVETPAETETPAAGAESIEVMLMADPGYDVTGTATLDSVDETTEVAVSIDGGLEEGSHQNHIHEGSCDARGDVAETLTALEAGADGSASASTTIEEPLSHFTEEAHYVAVHALDGTVVACGDIEAAS